MFLKETHDTAETPLAQAAANTPPINLLLQGTGDSVESIDVANSLPDVADRQNRVGPCLTELIETQNQVLESGVDLESLCDCITDIVVELVGRQVEVLESRVGLQC